MRKPNPSESQPPVPGHSPGNRRHDPLEDTWLVGLARLMDSRFRIPGTGIRFGLDSLLGLVPGIGDTAGFFLSGIIPLMAASKGVSGRVLLTMAGNILLDYAVGTIPILGDVFDVAFKANRRNLRLLRRELSGGDRRRAGRWKMAAVLLILVLLAAGMFALIALAFRAIVALSGTNG